jgi:hypothetical protein
VLSVLDLAADWCTIIMFVCVCVFVCLRTRLHCDHFWCRCVLKIVLLNMPNPTATFLASMMEGHFEASKAARLAMSSATAPSAPRFGTATIPTYEREANGLSGDGSMSSVHHEETSDASHPQHYESTGHETSEGRRDAGQGSVSGGLGTLGSVSMASSKSPSSSLSSRRGSRDGVT